jgi:leucyl/phenylalanyl-tRNA---protein transferase
MLAGRPNPETIEADFLLAAYSAGFFPMADSSSGKISWYSPDPRGVIPLHALRVSRSLRQTLKKKLFEVRFDTQFDQVMRLCAERPETWISGGLVASYTKLFELGFAHSVECWQTGELVGGLYGVALGGAFFGESMFSRKRDASKVALVSLVGRLRERGFELLDTQFITPHLASLGGKEIPRAEYLRDLASAVGKNCFF